MNLQQGQIVQLSTNPDQTYQVLSIDQDGDCCWLRRWPLSRHGSPAFAAPLSQVACKELAPS
ncbi:conserved hypothetical protein [Cyanobium sp. PCC 7001]|jgi:hypothetical protein|uniref:hypothetical protein n=1 Tax=Cyanobium sp. PCC 7001 TaxID=180281 RepID=UPI0001805CF1|nr:hypothetical protein [Cyanobium sp. PCC 7001]EDY39747.1 conserved hypothetical protein [Cyanobium sp. PCC 7001]